MSEKAQDTNAPETSGSSQTNVGKVVLAVVLLAVAALLLRSRYLSASVDWYLGNLAQNPGDAETRSALARLGVRALPRLEEELNQPLADSRCTAILAIDTIDGPEADALLAKATKDEDDFVATNATYVCGHRHTETTDRAIVEALETKARNVRYAARMACAQRYATFWWALGGRAGRGG